MANNIFGILILTDHHERKQESLSDELFINAIIFCHATLGLQVSLLVLPSRTKYPTFFHANPFYWVLCSLTQAYFHKPITPN